MRRRTLVNGAIITGALATVTGLGVAIASAATNPSDPAAGPSASASAGAPSGPVTSASATATATATASPSASSSSDGSECAKVYLTTDPAGDSVGNLCTAVDSSGTAVDSVTITFTASSSCSGSLMLRVSGADSTGAEFGEVEKVTCSSGKATASFDPVSKVTSNTFICGTLLADKYTAAQACVTVS